MLGAVTPGERLILLRLGVTGHGIAAPWSEAGTINDVDYFTASYPVRGFYADPGPLNCSAERDSVAGAIPNSVTFTIWGYFVDCPTCRMAAHH